MFLLSILVTSLTLTYSAHAIPAAPPLQSSSVNQNVTLLPAPAPRIKAPPSTAQSVLYTWSDDPACASTTTKASCVAALASICTSGGLDQSMKHAVGGCAVWYWFDAGNTIPTAAECSASYAEILATSNGFGSLGYGADGMRTVEPLYAVYPTGGNGNCFKAPGDTSPVLAMDKLPDGKTSLKQCGGAMTKRDLEERGAGVCVIENVGWQAFCNGVCLSTVIATSWLYVSLQLHFKARTQLISDQIT